MSCRSRCRRASACKAAHLAIERSAAPLALQRLPERSAVNMDWGFDAEGAEEGESGRRR